MRSSFFEAIHLNILTLWQERNIQFGLVETSCRYSSPGRYHQKIKIVTEIDALEKKTLTLKHDIICSETDKLMVRGLEKRICMNVADPEKIRAINIPDDIYVILKRSQTQ